MDPKTNGFNALRARLRRERQRSADLQEKYAEEFKKSADLEERYAMEFKKAAELEERYAEGFKKTEELEKQLVSEREKNEELQRQLSEAGSARSVYERASGDEEVKNRIISDYLMSLGSSKAPSLITTGVTALTPVSRPKTLADAKRLADKIIKS